MTLLLLVRIIITIIVCVCVCAWGGYLHLLINFQNRVVAWPLLHPLVSPVPRAVPDAEATFCIFGP